ncbi:hypothetical protein ACHBTE_29075 [Streptomyces sp. M41]|uniref:hypothetical protein n=1 Tax=Streptomyces sp. M41 TaxID=3059412 RepID=UPI00374D4D1E
MRTTRITGPGCPPPWTCRRRTRPDAVASDDAVRSAHEVEEAVYTAGGPAVALGTPEGRAAHQQTAAVARRPVGGHGRFDEARARARRTEARARTLPSLGGSPCRPPPEYAYWT